MQGGDGDVSTSGVLNASNLVWKRYPGKTCWWGGNGAAREIEGEGVQAPDVSSLAGCQASCLGAGPACDAVLYSDVGDATRCYRKGGIVLARCHPDTQLDLYRLEMASPPSPPALPYDPHSATGLVAMLNAKFDLGSPAPALADNGVLIRQFDDLSAGGLNHDGNGEPWKPCPAELWCGKFHAQWPATIVNTHARHTYYPSEGGIVFNAGLVDLFCIYNDDGNSMEKTCDGGVGDGTNCIPGCYSPGQQCQDTNTRWSCSWPPSRLADAMQAQLDMGGGEAIKHNEAVIDTRSIEANLPQVITAFFYMGADTKARTARSNFLRAYGLSSDQVPLVHIDLQAGSNVPAITLVAS